VKPLLEAIKATTHLGEVPSHVFQPEIARRLEIPTHPRKVVMLTFEETIAHFAKLVRYCICSCFSSSYSFSRVCYLNLFIL
jgi:hypothetical protein